MQTMRQLALRGYSGVLNDVQQTADNMQQRRQRAAENAQRTGCDRQRAADDMQQTTDNNARGKRAAANAHQLVLSTDGGDVCKKGSSPQGTHLILLKPRDRICLDRPLCVPLNILQAALVVGDRDLLALARALVLRVNVEDAVAVIT
jgi:hypothetical protein